MQQGAGAGQHGSQQSHLCFLALRRSHSVGFLQQSSQQTGGQGFGQGGGGQGLHTGWQQSSQQSFFFLHHSLHLAKKP